MFVFPVLGRLFAGQCAWTPTRPKPRFFLSDILYISYVSRPIVIPHRKETQQQVEVYRHQSELRQGRPQRDNDSHLDSADDSRNGREGANLAGIRGVDGARLPHVTS